MRWLFRVLRWDRVVLVSVVLKSVSSWILAKREIGLQSGTATICGYACD